MRLECLQANETCKYFERPPPPELRRTQEHGCYSDLDHIISQRLATDALSRYVINRPENKQQICRAEHDEKNYREQTTGIDDYELPPREELVEIALNDHEAGRHLPRSVRRAIRNEQMAIAERRADLVNNFWQRAEERRA